MKQKIKVLFILSFVVFFILMFVYNESFMKGVRNGVYLSISVMIPSLFAPMAVCAFFQKSSLIRYLGKYSKKISSLLFSLPPVAFPSFLLSCISGYPVGASIANSLYKSGDLTKIQGQILSSVSCSAGPAFIVIAVGNGMIGSKQIGYLLLTVHIVTSIFTAMIFSKILGADDTVQPRTKQKTLPLSVAFVESVSLAGKNVLIICGFTILFSGVVEIITAIFHSDIITTIFACLLEISNGCVNLKTMNLPPAFFAAVLGFGGLSVICQVISAQGGLRTSIFQILLIRVFHAMISYFLCTILLLIFPVTVPAAQLNSIKYEVFSNSAMFAVILVVLSFAFMLSVYQNKPKSMMDFLKTICYNQ